MRSIARTRILWAVVGVLALALSASADTLKMTDGRVIYGRYLGGTETYLKFMVNGKIQEVSIDQIVSLNFGSGAPATQPEASSVPAPALAPPAQPTDSSGLVTIPAGTQLLVRMIDSVNSDTNHVGDRFRASLESDLTVNGAVIAPKGTDVYGRLAEAKAAGKIAGKSELRLELTDILINQKLFPLLTGEYAVAGSSRGASTAKRVGGAAAVGAIIGAIAGGGKGAAIGAGVGAGAGTAVQVMTRGEQVHVPSETLLEFRLEQPASVEVAGR